MNIYHDLRPCTPNGHSAFRGYDAIVGKVQCLGGGLARAHQCQKYASWFGTAERLSQHLRDKHGDEA
jgi:hypothetical protein